MSEHRLIYADELYDTLANKLTWLMRYGDDVYLEVGKDIREVIDAQPTAYDIDKVVEQLNNLDVGTLFCSQCKYVKECETIADEMMEKYELNDRVDLCAMVMKTKAIEIVKKGGAE